MKEMKERLSMDSSAGCTKTDLIGHLEGYTMNFNPELIV